MAHHAFVHAADRGVLVATAITIVGTIIAALTLPGPVRATEPTPTQRGALAPATEPTPTQHGALARA